MTQSKAVIGRVQGELLISDVGYELQYRNLSKLNPAFLGAVARSRFVSQGSLLSGVEKYRVGKSDETSDICQAMHDLYVIMQQVTADERRIKLHA